MTNEAMATVAAKHGVAVEMRGGLLKLSGGDAKGRAKLVAAAKAKGARVFDAKDERVWLEMR